MIKKCVQVILLVALTSLLSIAAWAQEVSQDKSEAKASLELKLTTITTALCLDSKLVLELHITNISQETVTLNTAALWQQFSYAYYASEGGGKGGGMGINHGGVRDEKTVLTPGMTYRSTHEFPLDFDFFQQAGNYTLKTGFNSINSNEVKFELYHCGKPQEVEEQK